MERSNPADAGRSFVISSKAFENGQPIPEEYTCDGENMSPSLAWRGAPENVASYALIMDDPDAPMGIFVHWTIYNIPASSTGLDEAVPPQEQLPDGTRQGRNSFNKIGYGGPCPPPGKAHRYYFKLYALDVSLTLNSRATKKDILKATEGHVLAQTELMGTYKR